MSIRASAMVWARAEKRVYSGATAGAPALLVVSVKRVSSPSSAAAMASMAPEIVEWPERYSGCEGVVPSGLQDGSAVVAGLPSSSACGIACSGRQKPYLYL